MRARRRTRQPAPAQLPSTRLRRSSSPTAIMRRRCSTWSAPATSIHASPIRHARCWKSGSARWKVASARSRWRVARPPCTWRSQRSWARALTSSPRAPSMADRTTCSTLRCRASASRPASSIRAIWTNGARRSGRKPDSFSARRSAIRAWRCSTSLASPRSRTSTSYRCWSIRRLRHRISCGRSTTAPIWSITRRRNFFPGTAW